MSHTSIFSKNLPMHCYALLLLFYIFIYSTSYYMASSLRLPLVRLCASRSTKTLSSAHWLALRCSSTSQTIETKPPSAPPVVAAKASDLSLMEIRVGKIVEIGKHPEADSLYVEKVDIGETTGPRTIVSGLVAFCAVEDLLNRKVTVLCNLKPRSLKGVTSYGMLLCASNADHTKVVPLYPPESAAVGELITFEGHPAAPAEPGNRASKAYTKIADDFFVDDNGVATYKGIAFMTTSGAIHSPLKGKIS